MAELNVMSVNEEKVSEEKINNKAAFPPIVMWIALLVFYIYQFIARSAFPTVLTDQYMKFFNLDAKGVGALASCYYFVYTFAQIPVGILIDKCSIRLIGTLATATCATGVLIFIAIKHVIS